MRIGLAGWSGSLMMLVAIGTAEPAAARTKCDMTFTMEGWSVFYKAADGSGIVRCDNGQQVRVRLETRGGGVTFGRSKIVDGTGEFSPVADIAEVFGNYANAEVHAGMGVSSGAQVVTKGSVSLALSGTGNGVDLGFALGRFTIMRAARAEPIERPREERFRDEDLPPGASGSTDAD
ncbi:MAG: hypothetical protein IT293_02245 [Deltaproteobacteria bacterium]|nr:hypothetical protein [Deltaproteobacteria bacterium]